MAAWLLAAGCHPTSAGLRPEADACSRAWACWLFGGQRICNPQAVSQGLGWAASVARLVAIDLGLGLVSRIWGLPGQRQEGQLAAASDQADRPGVRPLLGGMKAGGKGGIGSPRV